MGITQFAQAFSTLLTSTPLSFVSIYPVDASTLLLVVNPFTPVYIRIVDIISPLLVEMTHAERQTFLADLTQALFIAGWIIPSSEDRIGVNKSAETWVVNMETEAATQYDGFGFNSFAYDGTRYLAAAEDGIYELAGPDDAGTPILSELDLPLTSFGDPHYKLVPNVWLGIKSNGQVILKTETEGQTFYYTANQVANDQRNQRVDIGKGLKGVYWSFTITSLLAIEMESVNFMPIPVQRRT